MQNTHIRYALFLARLVEMRELRLGANVVFDSAFKEEMLIMGAVVRRVMMKGLSRGGK